MTGDRYFITTSIPYVNARPHIGFALEAVQTDALARYHRLRGDDTRFQTGTDDNALKNVQAAEAEGLPTQTLVDRNAGRFLALREPLALSFDDFVRTSNSPRHEAGVTKLWQACARGRHLSPLISGALLHRLRAVLRRRRARGRPLPDSRHASGARLRGELLLPALPL